MFFPCLGFSDAQRVGKMRATVDILYITGNAQLTRAYQACNEQTDPGASSVVGSPISVAGIDFAAAPEDVTSTTASKQFVRPGYQVKNATGTTLNFVFVASTWEIQEP